jgi:uncharacterized protein YwqG
MTMPSIETRLREAGLERIAAPLAALARPCVHLLSRPMDDEEIPVGTSKLGGAPDLPEGTGWPEWKGAPLAFLLQANLGTLVGMPGMGALPDAGLLSFFYEVEEGTGGGDPADRGSWRVLYAPPGAPLRRTALPQSLPEHGKFASCTLEADAAMSLPVWEEPEVRAIGLDYEEEDILSQLPPRDGYDAYGYGLHQVFGWPEAMQSVDMDLQCQEVSSGIPPGGAASYDATRMAEHEAAAAEWRMLLQIASDENAQMMWGDLGKLYFWIRESDLAVRNWDGVWMVLQCA